MMTSATGGKDFLSSGTKVYYRKKSNLKAEAAENAEIIWHFFSASSAFKDSYSSDAR